MDDHVEPRSSILPYQDDIANTFTEPIPNNRPTPTKRIRKQSTQELDCHLRGSEALDLLGLFIGDNGDEVKQSKKEKESIHARSQKPQYLASQVQITRTAKGLLLLLGQRSLDGIIRCM